MYKVLETERLRIRPINLDDADFILRLVNSEGWLRFIGDRNVKDKADAENYIRKFVENQSCFYNIFELKSSGEALGVVSFMKREHHSYPDIGFALLPQYEKKGYTFEASKRYLDEILTSGSVDKIIGITQSENTGSIRLLEKLGLAFENKSIENEVELLLFGMSVKKG
jgi:[ribosomal protein S5]-alanine N-acetyltransferase